MQNPSIRNFGTNRPETRQQALTHLKEAYPEIASILEAMGPLEAIEDLKLPPVEAMTRIIVNQMLSESAANSIYRRVVDRRNASALPYSWLLSEEALRSAGLSKAKVRAIKEFGAYSEANAEAINDWHLLDHEALRKAVSTHWGLSDWSADILAIFYMKKPDVFPVGDGALKRAIRKCSDIYKIDLSDTGKGRPYRSYLARYLWRAEDEGYLEA